MTVGRMCWSCLVVLCCRLLLSVVCFLGGVGGFGFLFEFGVWATVGGFAVGLGVAVGVRLWVWVWVY